MRKSKEYVNEREIKFFRQIARSLDSNQIKWILERDYPEWEKQIVREEIASRNKQAGD